MRCLFVSDAHYPKSSTIVDFLISIVKQYDTVYILGDLFEFYYGYEKIYPHHRPLIEALGLVAQYSRVVLFEGNHEYRLKNIKRFLPVEVIDDYTIETIDSKRVYLAHGDAIDKNDKFYMLFRSFLKNDITLEFINRCVPPKILLKLAGFASDFSKSKLKNKPYRGTYRALEEFAKKQLNEVDVVILAHTHKSVFKNLENGLYINTGDFFEQFSYVVYENGEFCMKKFVGGKNG